MAPPPAQAPAAVLACPLQCFGQQGLARGKVRVESHTRRTGGGGYFIDRGRRIPLRLKELKGRVEEFAQGWGSSPELCFPCDVASDEEIAKVFEALSKKWDGLDCIVHSVGFAPGDQLDGDFTVVGDETDASGEDDDD